MTRGGGLEQRLRAMFDAARSHSPLSRMMALSLLVVASLFLGIVAVIQPVQTSSEVVAAEKEQEAEQEAVVTRDAQGRLVLEAGRWEHEVQVKDTLGKPVVGAKLVKLGLGTAGVRVVTGKKTGRKNSSRTRRATPTSSSRMQVPLRRSANSASSAFISPSNIRNILPGAAACGTWTATKSSHWKTVCN